MEVETVSQAIHVTRQLLGSMRLPITDTENIDKAGGEGTAVFAAEAIRIHCASR